MWIQVNLSGPSINQYLKPTLRKNISQKFSGQGQQQPQSQLPHVNGCLPVIILWQKSIKMDAENILSSLFLEF